MLTQAEYEWYIGNIRDELLKYFIIERDKVINMTIWEVELSRKLLSEKLILIGTEKYVNQ